MKKDKMRGICKAISIIAKINYIAISIAGSFIILGMFFIPFLVSNVNITDSNITMFNHTYSYNIQESQITFNEHIIENNTYQNFHILVDTFKEHSKFTIISVVECALVLVIVTLLCMFLALKTIYKLFKNIYDGYTPFTEDNISHIKAMAKYMIIAVAVSAFGSAVFESIVNYNFGFEINLIEILAILILFALAYIFEYGYKLQQEIDTTL